MSDYELQLKIRNAPMLNRMREAGFQTAAQLSRASGVCQGAIGAMLALKQPLYSPAKNRGSYHAPRPAAVKIAETLDCAPTDIYPESHYFAGLSQSEFRAQLSAHQMESLTHMSTGDPAMLLEFMEDEILFDFEQLIEATTLTERQQSVLRKRFADGKTQAVTAQELGVSKERIRQIEAQAVRLLRKSTRKPDSKLVEAAQAML